MAPTNNGRLRIMGALFLAHYQIMDAPIIRIKPVLYIGFDEAWSFKMFQYLYQKTHLPDFKIYDIFENLMKVYRKFVQISTSSLNFLCKMHVLPPGPPLWFRMHGGFGGLHTTRSLEKFLFLRNFTKFLWMLTTFRFLKEI